VNGNMDDIAFEKVQITSNAILAFIKVKGNIKIAVNGLK
jgi:hypothetical protein